MNNFGEKYLNTILEDGLTVKEHMEIGYENTKHKIETSSNPKFHRTFDERKQSLEFSSQHSKIIKKYENKIYLNKEMNISNKFLILIAILKCNISIHYYYKLKKFCYKNNGEIYFQDMWEYCHNSKNECFEYITETKELKEKLLKYL